MTSPTVLGGQQQKVWYTRKRIFYSMKLKEKKKQTSIGSSIYKKRKTNLALCYDKPQQKFFSSHKRLFAWIQKNTCSWDGENRCYVQISVNRWAIASIFTPPIKRRELIEGASPALLSELHSHRIKIREAGSIVFLIAVWLVFLEAFESVDQVRWCSLHFSMKLDRKIRISIWRESVN